MLTRQLALALGSLVVAAVVAFLWLRPPVASVPDSPPRASVRVSIRNAPQSLSWFTRHDAGTHVVSLLTQASLVRVNRTTQELEPWLADRWDRSNDGLRYTLTLRPDAVFSDGTPMTSADVTFSFAAAFDKESLLSDVLTVGGDRITAAAVDPRTVAITFPSPFGPGLRILDGLPILPRHKLESSLRSGTFGASWRATSAPADVVGLGPFRLTDSRGGEQLVFEANPHYFRRNDSGGPYPRVARLVLQVLPNQDAQILALQSGESDGSASEIRPGDYGLAKQLADSGEVRLHDLGPGMDPDGLWINLRPGAFDGDSRRTWIQRDEVRQAISLGVDRQLFADTVFAGAAEPVFGPITLANRHWWVAPTQSPRADLAAARARLAAAGLSDRDGDGLVDDEGTRHARITLLTQKGQTSLERGASAVRDQMRLVGLSIDVVPMEAGALIQRFLSGAGYDAVYFNLTTTDTDPASQLDFWTSRGSAHVWNLGAPAKPLEWERQIDDLMAHQTTSLDDLERVQRFAQVQGIFAAHVPMIHFAVPRVFVATSTRLKGLTLAPARPQWLWAADTVDVEP